jgi:hypothetical protein
MKSEVMKEARKHYGRGEFSQGSPGAYKAAARAGILDSACGHMKVTVKPNYYWSLARIAVEAKKYNVRAHFKHDSGGAYMAAKRFGVLDKVCRHMSTDARKNRRN